MDYVGGLIVGLRRRKTVPSAALRKPESTEGMRGAGMRLQGFDPDRFGRVRGATATRR